MKLTTATILSAFTIKFSYYSDIDLHNSNAIMT